MEDWISFGIRLLRCRTTLYYYSEQFPEPGMKMHVIVRFNPLLSCSNNIAIT